MLSQSLLVLAAATGSLAVTPAGFQPQSTVDLVVDFGSIAAQNGAVVAQNSSQKQPTVATKAKLTGTSYAIMMIDLDIPGNTTGTTNTLLHWMQTGLTPATTATALNTTAGSAQVYMLQMPQSTAAMAAYLGPNPPAKQPISHRYTQILVDTSSMSSSASDTLKSAAATRMGFSAETVLTKAKLQDKVVAGNYFNVTNSAATNTTTGGGTTGGGAATTSAAATAKPTASANPTTTGTPVTASAIKQQVGSLFAGLAAVGILFVAL